MNYLELRAVDFHYGSNQVLHSVTCAMRPGVTGLLGNNGAGKTTLLRLSVGLLGPSAGEVRLFDRNPQSSPELRLRTGYLPQDFRAPPSMRVSDYLECMGFLSGLSRRGVREAVHEAVTIVGLGERSRVKAGSLSGGMLRRVGLAQALLHSPDLLILDEPTAGLDPDERLRMYETLRQSAGKRPVLVSSHQVDEIEREADHVWILAEGRLRWAGSVVDGISAVSGQIREGVLPNGIQPRTGQVLMSRPADGGHYWRILGEDPRLQPCEARLLDFYLHLTRQCAHTSGGRLT